jgi:hypothetical protein
MISGISEFIPYFKKEEKPACDNEAGLNLAGLKKYIISKTAYTTALEVGKYKLALYLESDVKERIKSKDINYEEMQRNFYIAYKVNEFLEQPGSYAKMSDPPTSIFVNRDGMQELLEEGKVLGLEFYSERAMEALFNQIKIMYNSVALPLVLPEQVYRGSTNYWLSYIPKSLNCSNFHPVIKDLYEQCQKKLLELEKAKNALPSPS